MNPTVAQGASAHAPCYTGRQAHGGQASSAWLCMSGYRRHRGWHGGLASHGPRPGSSKMPGLSRRPGSRAWGRGVTADSLEGAERGTWWLCPEMGQRHADSGGCAVPAPQRPGVTAERLAASSRPRGVTSGNDGHSASVASSLGDQMPSAASRPAASPGLGAPSRVGARGPAPSSGSTLASARSAPEAHHLGVVAGGDLVAVSLCRPLPGLKTFLSHHCYEGTVSFLPAQHTVGSPRDGKPCRAG